MIPRRIILPSLFTLPSTFVLHLHLLRSLPSPYSSLHRSQIDPMDDESIHYFTFYVRAAASEFLNDIEQHSYEKLDDQWWLTCHKNIMKMVYDYKSSMIIIETISDSILAKFPKITSKITSKMKESFKDCIRNAYISYNAATNCICYCGNHKCIGDCGVLDCGCIDMCRGRCGISWDRYDRR